MRCRRRNGRNLWTKLMMRFSMDLNSDSVIEHTKRVTWNSVFFLFVLSAKWKSQNAVKIGKQTFDWTVNTFWWIRAALFFKTDDNWIWNLILCSCNICVSWEKMKEKQNHEVERFYFFLSLSFSISSLSKRAKVNCKVFEKMERWMHKF